MESSLKSDFLKSENPFFCSEIQSNISTEAKKVPESLLEIRDIKNMYST